MLCGLFLGHPIPRHERRCLMGSHREVEYHYFFAFMKTLRSLLRYPVFVHIQRIEPLLLDHDMLKMLPSEIVFAV